MPIQRSKLYQLVGIAVWTALTWNSQRSSVLKPSCKPACFLRWLGQHQTKTWSRKTNWSTAMPKQPSTKCHKQHVAKWYWDLKVLQVIWLSLLSSSSSSSSSLRRCCCCCCCRRRRRRCSYCCCCHNCCSSCSSCCCCYRRCCCYIASSVSVVATALMTIVKTRMSWRTCWWGIYGYEIDKVLNKSNYEYL